MKQYILFICLFFIGFLNFSYSQVGINTDGTTPHSSAMLDVKSNNKGFLPPRMTTAQISAIENPANGLLVFCTTDNKMYIFVASVGLWKEVSYGTGTISVSVFLCGDPLIDSRDGQSYATVSVGNQCWMAENLNIGTMINSGYDQTDNGTIEKHCYNNNINNCNTYGGHYQWDEMMQYTTTPGTQGICPSGWHIPTDNEWKTMEMQLGLTQAEADATGFRGTDQGSQLAGNEPLWTDGLLDQNANFGTSGFDALPAGYRYTDSNFYEMSTRTQFWVSDESDASNSWGRKLLYNKLGIGRGTWSKAYSFSMRCVKD